MVTKVPFVSENTLGAPQPFLIEFAMRQPTRIPSPAFPRLALCGLCLLAICFAPSDAVRAESPRVADCVATELLPDSIVAWAEIPDLGSTLQTVLSHPLRSKLEALPAYDAFMQSGAPGQIQTGLRAFEATMGMPWQDAIGVLTDRGISIALDSKDGGVAVLIHSSDAELLERFRGFVLALRQLQGATAKQADYRGFMADLVTKELKMVRMNDWLLLTNNSELGKAIMDQYLDRDGPALATDPMFVTASERFAEGDFSNRVVNAFVDIRTLRDAGVGKDVFNEKIDNVAAEAGLGGILANLRHTPFVTGQLNLSDVALSLQLTTPHDRQWEAPREYFFGQPDLAAAPPLIDVPDRLFALSTHRDFSQMWLRAGDLLSDRAVDQLAVADTTLTTFFSGRDFGEDILGALQSDVQLVGARQDFGDVLPQPSIKLPAMAVVFQMKDPEQTRPELRRVFQSLVGFLNVIGAQNGQPQLDLGMESIGDAQLVTATYVPDKDQRESLHAPIQFNFSPTVAFAGQRIVIASSTSLARTLVQDSGDTDVDSNAPQSGVANTSSILQANTLQQVLEANRAQLIANSMLEKGHSKEAAEGEISLLLELVRFFRDLRLDLRVDDSHMTLGLAVNVNSQGDKQP